MFPAEITAWPQWVCWHYANTDDKRLTKLPLNPRNGKLASVTDPRTWTDYDTAVRSATEMKCGIGFVLTENDPFIFIDFDNPNGDVELIRRHEAIANAMDSYSEISPSGFGLHVIVKAQKLAGKSGIRGKKLEIYSSQRYMTMTGNTWHEKPIQERTYLVNQLWAELDDSRSAVPFIQPDLAEQYTDDFIYTIASTADNGEKFTRLWNGNFQEYYPSQSEADFALINILGFYSRNVNQIKRLFFLSALGKRDKAKRKNYVDAMVRRSFDNQVPLVPVNELLASVANQLAKKDAEKDKAHFEQNLNPFEAGTLFANIPDANYDWTCPPGLMGEIAKFIFEAAIRPVKEIALGAAIGIMAGICGRAYNVSGTGLNQYVLILARTGTGKEAAAGGIDRLLQAVRFNVPAISEFIGPADIASGQALSKYLDKHPCFVSIVGEFGLALQQMCSVSASNSQVTLRKNLLALYNKSGASDVLQPMIYSDKEKNTHPIKSPAFSLLGESTPETFYESLDEGMIASGLFPRFTCIEYLGERPESNENHNLAMPSQELINNVGALAAHCLVMAQHNRNIDVELDMEAKRFAKDFDKECDAKINSSENEVSRQLWNRGHIKALKLAALIAIGKNPFTPVIDLGCIKWAVMLVERDIKNILEKFNIGKVGRDTNELHQQNELLRMISDYIRRPFVGLEKYRVLQQMHADRVITMGYLQRRLLLNTAFKNDRVGATNALKRTVESLVQDGVLRLMRETDTYARYQCTMKCFIVADIARL